MNRTRNLGPKHRSQARAVAVISAGVVAFLAAMHPVALLVEYRPLPIESLNIAFTRFDLGREQGAGTWASSAGLGLAGLVMLHIASRTSAWVRHWRYLGIIFILLSLDETASFHELASPLVRSQLDLPGFLSFAWVLPGAVFVLVVGALYLRFVLALPRATRALVIAAGLVYLSGAMGMEMLGAHLFMADGRTLVYRFAVMIEETLEMTGIAIMLFTVVRYAAAIGAPALPVAPTTAERSAPAPG